MRNIWLVIRWEYLTRIKSKGFIASLALLPLIMGTFIFVPTLLVQATPNEGLTIAIIDESGVWEGPVVALLDQMYTKTDGAPLYPRFPLAMTGIVTPQEDAAMLLEQGVIGAYLVIKADFDSSGQVDFYSEGVSGMIGRGQIRGAVNRAWRSQVLSASGVPGEIQQALVRGVVWRDYQPSAGDGSGDMNNFDEAMNFMRPIMLLVILFMVIMITSQSLMRSIIGERGNRMAEILLSSVSAEDLMTGKILGIGLMGLTQLTTYLVVGMLVRTGTGGALISMEGAGLYLLYAIGGYFLFAAIYGGIGSMFESEQDAQQVMAPLTLLMVLPMVFSSVVIFQPDSTLVRVLSYFPPFTPFLMILRLDVSDVPWWEIVTTLLVLAGTTVLLLRWAGVIFRTAILMYGQKITLSEIIRWVRAG